MNRVLRGVFAQVRPRHDGPRIGNSLVVQQKQDEALAEAWPWGKVLHNPARSDALRHSGLIEARDLMYATHGAEEGRRLWEEDFLPRLRNLRAKFLVLSPSGYAAENEHTFKLKTDDDRRVEMQKRVDRVHRAADMPWDELMAALDDPEVKGNREMCDFAKKSFEWRLKEAVVWLPMQEIHLAALLPAIRDEIPDEFYHMAEARASMSGEGDGDVTPAFTPLPTAGAARADQLELGGSNPAFLPVYFDEKSAEAQVARLREGAEPGMQGAIRYFAAPMRAVDVFHLLLEDQTLHAGGPGSDGAAVDTSNVVVGVTHAAASRWYTKVEFPGVLNAEDPGPPPAGVDGAPEAGAGIPRESQGGGEGLGPADAASAAKEEELDRLLTQVVSLLKCYTRSVRFAYVNVVPVCGEELIKFGVEMATRHNDPQRFAAAAALAVNRSAKPRRKRRLRKLTGPLRTLALVRQAEGLLKQKPIPDLIDTPEPAKPRLVRLRGGWLRAVRPRVKKQGFHSPEYEYLKEPVVTYDEVVAQMRELSEVSHVTKKGFLSFVAVRRNPDTSQLEGASRADFEGIPPFFDSFEKYEAIERHLPSPEAMSMREEEDEMDSLAKLGKEYNRELSLTLVALRHRDGPDDEATVLTEAERDALTERQMAQIVIGPVESANRRAPADIAFWQAKRQYNLLTKGIRAASQFGPVGYTPRSVLPVVGDYHEYLWKKTPATDRPAEGELFPRNMTRLDKLRQDEKVKRLAGDRGLQVQELATMSDLLANAPMTKDMRRYGPWHPHAGFANTSTWSKWGQRQ
ncbi:hypothetical protein DIPPA_23110 [Diplonema papillatum]|nr:hypothetical protein DIPPA_23110 [Diplonema papillatum]